MKVGYLEKPAPVPAVPEVKSTAVSFSVDPFPKASLKREAPVMDPLVDSFALAEPVAVMDDDMNKCADELHSDDGGCGWRASCKCGCERHHL